MHRSSLFYIALLMGICAAGPTTQAGTRRALLFGIDRYAAKPEIQDLVGAKQDVAAMKALLSNPQGFNFGEVISLVDEEATLARFRQEVSQLVARSAKDDVVLIYFAGYASVIPSSQREEPDNLDQTLVFHDSRTGNVPDLIDDQLNEMLKPLAERVSHLALIFDCGGQMPRGMDRSLAADRDKGRTARTSRASGTAKQLWHLPKTVLLSASAKVTEAVENAQGGLFTQALVRAWSEGDALARTYRETLVKVREALRKYNQAPHAEGVQGNFVFSPRTPENPWTWTVETVIGSGNDEVIILEGNILDDRMGLGAILAVFDVRRGIETLRPEEAKAEIVVTLDETQRVQAKVKRRNIHAEPIRTGDRAILLKPSDHSLHLKIFARETLPRRELKRLEDAVSASPSAFRIQWTTRPNFADMILESLENRWTLLDSKGRVRFESRQTGEARITEVMEALVRLARAHAVIRRAETMAPFNPNLLLARLVPAPLEGKEKPAYAWKPDPANRPQSVPLNQAFHLKVSLSAEATDNYYIGAVLVCDDGHMSGLPRTRLATPLSLGETVVFDDSMDLMRADIPETEATLYIFGTTQPIEWALFGAGPLPGRGDGEELDLLKLLDQPSEGRGQPTAWDDRHWVVTALRLKVRTTAP